MDSGLCRPNSFMTPIRNRLLIGIDHGTEDMQFFSHVGTPLATGYTRVVIGKRGPYVEFEEKHIKWEHFFIPAEEAYRQHNAIVFYLEYRSRDAANVMLYFQRRKVAYADYKIGMCYIAPSDLLRTDMQPVILSP
jgi:hypothetical protein